MKRFTASEPSTSNLAAIPPSFAPSRRQVIGAGAAIAAVGALSLASEWNPAPASATSNPSSSGLASFARPPRTVAPKFRWWWPNGQVDPAEIRREIDAVADAGCGGLEIASVHHSGLIDLDVAGHGWGSAPWLAGLDAALSQAAVRGLTIDLSMGPSWPSAVSTITPDDPAASSELAHGVVTVAAGAVFDGPLPAGVLPPAEGVTAQKLFAVHALRTAGVPVKAIQPLDPASLIDLTPTVTNGSLTWTAPAGTDPWVVLAYWLRGSGQEPESGPFTTPTSYVVDHFSAAGTATITDMWEQRILSRRIRGLLSRVGGSFFEDSLEIETTSTIWTSALPEAFRANVGYELLPNLPIVVQLKGKYQFSFADEYDKHVRDDLNLTLSDLYRDHHLKPLTDWAHGFGMTMRVQPYGLSTDSIDFAGIVDIPEGESLGFKNLDDYRVLSGGRDLAGHTILSCEAICYANGAYSTSWNKALQTIGSYWAGGVNQSVIHGFAYADAAGATWPGFAAFSPYNKTGIGYSEAWGPRQPTWQHMPDIAGYVSRTQQVLQAGTPKYDVLFYRQKGYTSTGIGAPWATNVGIPTGWTHSFATDAALAYPGVEVSGGRLAPRGPAFKVVILGPDQFTGNERAISLAGAKRLLGFAQKGLPIIVIGDWSAAISTGHVDAATDAAVADTMRRLLAQKTVTVAADEAGIPAALAAAGIRPAVKYDTSTLMTVHRVEGGTDAYYLANARHAENRKLVPIAQTAWLTPSARGSVPYRLDAWTGEVTRIARYQVSDGRIGVDVALLPGESTIVVLAQPGYGGEGRAPLAQVVATDAEAVRWDGHRLVLRTSVAGRFSTAVASGRIIRSTIESVPEPLPLTSWNLTVEDWKPGASAHETIKPRVTVALDALVQWTAIPVVADASGIGHYVAKFALPARWGKRPTAVLDLGIVNDTFQEWVNGHRIPSEGVLSTRLDLGDRLRAGLNTIQVDVATSLINRLRTVTPEVYGIATPQAYGLLGPVRLLPYEEVVIG